MESAGGNAGTRLGGGIARENLEGGLVTMCVQRRHSEIEMVGDGRVGIGLGFARSHTGVYLVTQSLASSPAAELMDAGKIAVGDRIHAVDGWVVEGQLMSKVIGRIKGEPGTGVYLTLRRAGEEERSLLRLAAEKGQIRATAVSDSGSHSGQMSSDDGGTLVAQGSGEDMFGTPPPIQRHGGEGEKPSSAFDVYTSPGNVVASTPVSNVEDVIRDRQELERRSGVDGQGQDIISADEEILTLKSSVAENTMEKRVAQLVNENKALRVARDEAYAYVSQLEQANSSLLSKASNPPVQDDLLSKEREAYRLLNDQLEETRGALEDSKCKVVEAEQRLDQAAKDRSALELALRENAVELQDLRSKLAKHEHEQKPSPLEGRDAGCLVTTWPLESSNLGAFEQAAAEGGWELQHMLNMERENNVFLGQSLAEIQARCEEEIRIVKEEAARNPQIYELQRAVQEHKAQTIRLTRQLEERRKEIQVLGQGKALAEGQLDLLHKLKDEVASELEKTRDECKSAVDGQKTLHAQLDTLRRSQLFPDENGRRCPAETSRTSQNIVSNQDRASLSPVPFSTGLIPLHRERTPLLGEGFPGNVSSFSDALTSHHHRRHISNEGMPLPQYTSDASESMALGERSPTFNLSSQMSDHSASVERQANLLKLVKAEHKSDAVKRELLLAIDSAERVMRELSPDGL